jgi:radical SAM protein
MGKHNKISMDFNKKPFTVIYEITRACDLVCLHCRAEANTNRNPLELKTTEVFNLIEMIKEFEKPYPIFIITGGDPIKREDIFDIVYYAWRNDIKVALTPSATPLITEEVIKKLKESGLNRIALSLDGSNEEIHDNFRGIKGTFNKTFEILNYADKYNLETQIHTTLTEFNYQDIPNIVELIKKINPKLWAIFLLIQVGRAKANNLKLINPYKLEELFNYLYDLSKEVNFDITTREGYHYRRVIIQRKAKELNINEYELLQKVIKEKLTPNDLIDNKKSLIRRAPFGVNDGKGMIFINHVGEVQPSGFINLSAGNIRKQSLKDIYQNSKLLNDIRDYSKIKGKCGVCEYREICGGSRSRSYALTGSYHNSDPYCIYKPKNYLN